MIRDQRGTAVLVVIWMTGVLAVMSLNFASRVREASQEVRAAEARLQAVAAIDRQVAETVYEQLEAREEEAQASQDAGDGTGQGVGSDRYADEQVPAGGTVEPSVEPAATPDGEEQAASEGSDDGKKSLAETMVTVQQPITKTVAVGNVNLYLHAEPEMGRIDVNRGDPRVVRALLEKLADRGTASRAVEVMRRAQERAQRIGAVSGEEPPAFATVEAWIAAIELEPATADRIRPFVTTYTGARSVDLAYAPQEVIDILPFLSRSQKERIAKARERSSAALMQVLAQIAEDPTTAQDEAETEGEAQQATRQVMRVTVEATVEGVLRRTERIVLAFSDEGGGGGGSGGPAAAEEVTETVGIGAPPPDQAVAAPPPFIVLDRMTLDMTPAAAARAAAPPKEEGL
ncbi:MAG TPA: hypothetical protein VHL31_26200 [Geminicoccus sp.]|jgi:type II secretory pathway component PulK|uniref:hypothetical protein n=1 Tax=Geminicoccus sp. TaxID=2024832 RepID=UPI002E359720|nr:hypothetical protein [Geminicoccus sp.]HEX2529769.1 hypothetical protein [Geminicoccus sp.]